MAQQLRTFTHQLGFPRSIKQQLFLRICLLLQVQMLTGTQYRATSQVFVEIR